MEQKIKKVLIIRCGALGDLVYSTSVIDALRYEYGENTQIDFLTTPINAQLFKNDPRVNQLFFLKHKKFPILLSPQKQALIKHSRNYPYDLLINFEMGKQFKSLVEKVEAKKKSGWFSEEIHITKTHMVEICKEFYKSSISQENMNKSFPKLFGANFEEVKNRFNLPDKYLVFSPSNSHNRKKGLNYRAWPHKHWKKLLSLVPNNMPVVLIGAKGEEAFFEPLKPYSKNVIDLVSKMSIPMMISVVEHAKALVVTDTGTAHIASAVNTPVFCLIGPTPSEETGPYKTPFNQVEVIKANLPCSPCYKTEVMKECQFNECMEKITPEKVINRLSLANIL
ncbi:MAG: glycosyltransferase family 9 protein [Arcobacter sp.]|uniref:glycosyltransferase family 9 protein n=1 Tax=uncultured Arcobacter sp. TaxID=165434 RepID=UPI000CAE005F|nr:glycosyltransferase family 9 protein [uncultured Arcobacter sp.]PLY09878.1 MAG: glycosyltransferase family 9 protein [Arcobacter sp.]